VLPAALAGLADLAGAGGALTGALTFAVFACAVRAGTDFALVGSDDFLTRDCAGGVAAFGVPFFATPARSAMASPNNKTGARQVAAHSRGWQEYGT